MPTPWTSDIIVSGCGVLGKKEYAIKIPNNVNNAFLTLLKEIKTEWLMYLNFEEEESASGKLVTYTVTGYVIPEQEATHAHVKVLDAPEGEFGVIHAHQFSESRFFSGTDDAFVNSNNIFSMVINKKGEFLAKTRVPVPCGKFIQLPAKVFVSFSEHETVAEEMKDKIKARKYTKPYQRPTKTGSGDTKASVWQGRGAGSSTRQTTVTDRRIKDCPNKDDPSKCVRTSYFDCEYYWKACPKLEELAEQPAEEETAEATEETTETTAIVKVEIEEQDADTATTKDKKKEMEEVIAEIDNPSF